MGTTLVNLHVRRRADRRSGDMRSIARAIEKLGYRPVRRGEPAQKRVVLQPTSGGRFVSIYDSDNAHIDSGQLRELAYLLSKALGTTVLHASVYDSDRFALQVFSKGTVIDTVSTDPPEDDGTTRTATERRKLWRRCLHDVRFVGGFAGVPAYASKEESLQFEQAVAAAGAVQSAFADDVLEAWCRVAGLDASAALSSFSQIVTGSGAEVLELVADASRRAAPPAETPTGVVLSAMRYDEGMPWLRLSPAAWPALAGRPGRIGWCMKSAGDAVDVRAVELRLSKACDVQVQRLKLDAFPFHAGQVSGGAIAEFEWRAGGWLARRAVAERIEVSGFNVPSVRPATRNEYLVMLTIDLAAGGTADVTVSPAMVHGDEPQLLPLPSVRVRFIEPGWRPGVLQPLRERRSTADDPPAPEALRLDAMLRLNMPGVRSAAAVLEGAIAGRGAAARLVGAAVDAWGSVPGVSIELRTERQMTVMGNVTKGTKRFASDDASAARAVARALEDPGQQSVWIDVSRPGAFAPFAGALLQTTLQHVSRGADADDPGTCVCAVWAIVAGNAEDAGSTRDTATDESSAAVDASRHLDTARGVQAAFEEALADCAPLQGWSTSAAWIPTFMTAEDWAPTPYEIAAGIWTGSAAACMGTHWCARYLRMIAPTLWLGAALAAQVNREGLAGVADVSSVGATTRIALKPGNDLSLLDAALAPLWPAPPTGYR